MEVDLESPEEGEDCCPMAVTDTPTVLETFSDRSSQFETHQPRLAREDAYETGEPEKGSTIAFQHGRTISKQCNYSL